MKLRAILQGMLRRTVLFFGRIRRIDSPPFFTWDIHNPLISHDELDYLETIIEPGDIGLHLDYGFFSNLVIPGEYKHVWLFIGANQIVEATGTGVAKRHFRVPCRSDKLLVLRPKLSGEIRDKAAISIQNAIGMKYDTSFNFDLAEEFANLNKFDQSFSCIELVLYAYYESLATFGVQKTRYFGRDIYRPDSVINVSCDVIYHHDGIKRIVPADKVEANLSAVMPGPSSGKSTTEIKIEKTN